MEKVKKMYLNKEAVIRAIELTGVRGRKDPGCGVCGKEKTYDIYNRNSWEWALICPYCFHHRTHGFSFIERHLPGTAQVNEVPEMLPEDKAWDKHKAGTHTIKYSTEEYPTEPEIDSTEEGILGIDGDFDGDLNGE